MRSHTITRFFALTALLRVSIAGYVLTDTYARDNFFDAFTPFTETDPTAGFVQFVDYAAAMENKMIGSVSNYGNATYIGVDYNTTTNTGRQSLRITSKKSFTKGLFLADIAHMPGGICGVWPSFWLVGPNWPSMGEIDIIEGVNGATTNTMTLHTSSGCSIQKEGMSGTRIPQTATPTLRNSRGTRAAASYPLTRPTLALASTPLAAASMRRSGLLTLFPSGSSRAARSLLTLAQPLIAATAIIITIITWTQANEAPPSRCIKDPLATSMHISKT